MTYKATAPMLICLGLLLAACSPRVLPSIISQAYPALPETAEVTVLPEKSRPEGNVVYIGKVSATGKAADNRSAEEDARELIVSQARRAGSNMVLLTGGQADARKGRHTLTAQLLRKDNGPKAIDSTLLKEGQAMLHFYRPAGPGFMGRYDIHLFSGLLCKAYSRWKQSIPVPATGDAVRIWAKSGEVGELTMFLEPGVHYYIRCGMGVGDQSHTPTLQLVDPVTGAAAYEKLVEKDRHIQRRRYSPPR